MSVLTRKQIKCLDRLFYDAAALGQAVREMRSVAVTSAEQSADPTARRAVVVLDEIPEAMGYKRPEAWLQVVEFTWAKYHSETATGKAMRRRYIRRESPETTCINEHISQGTYWNWREDFLIFSAITSAREGLL